ncbi:hypothetical protein TIFTF001_005691 [Ficus carica]|uniref:Uncharacterized protein n=1 Tax=Ficus carica TaxID=3494 RepID=A0AA88CXV7_FICCA|nr:hypothetical protein TIFTF001_005691 [Ficus carica]
MRSVYRRQAKKCPAVPRRAQSLGATGRPKQARQRKWCMKFSRSRIA